MKRFIQFCLWCVIISAQGQTIIPDNTNISGNWTLANSPYIVQGRAIVPNAQTLTIEAGVEVRFTSSSSPTTSWFDFSAGNVGVIRVQGEIIANGTSTNPILFTRDGSSGYWGTVLIDENASIASSFSHCIFEYSKETRNVPGITGTVAFSGGLSLYRTGVNIQNCIFKNNQINGMYITEVNNHFIFSNNQFHNNGTNGLVIEQSTDVKCINSIFYSNSLSATGQPAAIRSSNSSTYLIGNLIYNNDDFGIFTNSSGNNRIINNTIYNNSQGIRVENGANTYIYNTIVQNNNINFATSSPGSATIEMRNSLTNAATFPANVNDMGGNILNSNALFINASSNNYSLQNNSPCIDAGATDTSGLFLPTLDILGNQRISNATIDIGAIEFQNTTFANYIYQQPELKVYPNPANENVYVFTKGFLYAELFSVSGQLINSYNNPIINISNLPNGMYILKIITTNNENINTRLIKN